MRGIMAVARSRCCVDCRTSSFHGVPRCLRWRGQGEGRGYAPLRGQETVRRLVAGDLAYALGEDRVVFDPVPVGMDDGKFQTGTDFCGAAMTIVLASKIVNSTGDP